MDYNLEPRRAWGKETGEEAKRERTCGCTLGSFNVPIQSEAIIEVSESDFDSSHLRKASDWIGAFKGLNVWPEVLSVICKQENTGTQGRWTVDQSLT